MKAAMIRRRIDGLGRIVLPKELRDIQNLVEGTHIDIFLEADGSIILRKSVSCCVICGSEDIAWTHDEKSLCEGCIKLIQREEKSNEGICAQSQ